MRYARIVTICIFVLALSLILSRLDASWAQPQQNSLRDTINTPVPSPTGGPTSTPVPSPAPGVERVVLQEGREGYDGTQDTWIYSYQRNVVQPLAGGLKIKGGEIQSILVRFDLIGHLPADANVQRAELAFYVIDSQGRTLDVGAFRVLRDWLPTQVSWDYVHTGNDVAWDSPGCNGVGMDRVGDADGTTTLFHRAVRKGIDVTDSVRYWLEHPGENHGWLVKGVSPATAGFSVASSRNAAQTYRPLLRIDYTSGDGTPTHTHTPDLTTTATPTATFTPTPTAPAPEPTALVLDAMQDTYIDEWEPATTHNLGYMYVGYNGAQKGLVQFDLSLLPAEAQVISATLQLMTGSAASPLDVEVSAYKLWRDWEESSATWYDAMAEVPWRQAGANSTTDDYDPDMLDVVTVGTSDHIYAWDVTDAVRGWTTIGGMNHGLLLIGESSPQGRWSFLSSEIGVPAQEPKLRIAYAMSTPTETATATVEPTTATPTPTATFEAGSVQVFVYEDVDRDGYRDPGEEGIEGVRVDLLDYVTSQLLDWERTDDEGMCTFGGLTEEWYRLREYDLGGYSSSTANEVKVRIGPGGLQVAFGDYLLVSPTPTRTPVPDGVDIHVTVYGDENRNDVRDLGEGGLAGARLELRFLGGGFVDVGKTGADGRFTFAGVPTDTTYRLYIQSPTGYVAGGYGEQVNVRVGDEPHYVQVGNYPGLVLNLPLITK
jgi:hypothetical protein